MMDATRNKNKPNRNSDVFLFGLIICCILAYLAVFALINIRTLAKYCNSDVYADMQVAKMMWEQKTLFPEGWIFGNQYYIIATPVLAALMYGITGNINLAMGLATEVMTILIFLSLLWMLQSFAKEKLSFLTCCLLLLAVGIVPHGGMSLNTLFLFTQASFYACYLITMFVTFGDYIRTYHSSELRLVTWAVSLALCFATGMQSMRQMVVMVLPIIACELFQAFRRILRGEKLWNRTNWLCGIRPFSYCLANIVGSVAMDILNVPSSTIYGDMQLISPSLWLQRLQPIPEAIFQITGLDYVLRGEAGPGYTIAVFFWIILFLTAVVVWICRIHRQETDLEISWLLCFVGIIGVILSTIVLEITLRGVYLFSWFPLVAFSGAICLNKLSGKSKKGLIVLICILSMASLYDCFREEGKRLVFKQDSDASLMCQWAIDNGYEYVYGDYWGTAPQVAVHSGGTVEAGSWNTPEYIFVIERFNTPQDIYGEEDNARAIYVFTSMDEEIGLQVARERGATMELMAEFGIYRAYTASKQLMHK